MQMALAHAAGQRLRLVAIDPPDRAGLRSLGHAVEAHPRAARVTVRRSTGSLVIEALGPAGDLLDWLEAEGLIRLVETAPPRATARSVRSALHAIDTGLLIRTRGALDLRSGLAAAMIAGDMLGPRRLR